MSKPPVVNFPVYLHIKTMNGKNCLEIRRRTTEVEAIKTILESAILARPIVVIPVFTNYFAAIHKLAARKIIKYDYKNNEYEFILK